MKRFTLLLVVALVLSMGCLDFIFGPEASPSPSIAAASPSVVAPSEVPTVVPSEEPTVVPSATPILVEGDHVMYYVEIDSAGMQAIMPATPPNPDEYEDPSGKYVYSCVINSDGSRDCCVYKWAGDIPRYKRPLECDLLDDYLFGDPEDAFACYPYPDSNGECADHAVDKVTCVYSHTEQTPVFDIPSGVELQDTDVFICSNGKSFRDGPRKKTSNGNTVTLPFTTPDPLSVEPTPEPTPEPSPEPSMEPIVEPTVSVIPDMGGVA